MVNPLSRILHDVGLAAWFGGTLGNAVALNAAVAETTSSADSGAVVNAGWDRWTPVNAAAIGAHLIGSVGQLAGNSGRIAGQKGVGAMVIVKTATTVAALGATAYARVLGSRIDKYGAVPVQDATTPSAGTPAEVADAQSQLAVLQWAIPALTGALVVISAIAGEQQRSTAVLSGLVKRVTG